MNLTKSSAPNLSLALIHHPVVNRRGEPITAAVTNLDLPDIARAALTFGVRSFFVVTPLEAVVFSDVSLSELHGGADFANSVTDLIEACANCVYKEGLYYKCTVEQRSFKCKTWTNPIDCRACTVSDEFCDGKYRSYSDVLCSKHEMPEGDCERIFKNTKVTTCKTKTSCP